MITVNLVLAIVWVTLTGELSLVNFAAGFVLGYVILSRMEGASPATPSYSGRVRRMVLLLWAFFRELVKSNLRVAFEVITPPHNMSPGIVAIPLNDMSDAEIFLLSILLTLTPGTLTVDVDMERRILYLHDMYVDDPDTTRAAVRKGFGTLVREAMR